MSLKSNRSKACEFNQKEREAIKERDSKDDHPCCIFCGSPIGLQIAHFIPRSAGGLGIKENGACSCIRCHMSLDSGNETQRRALKDVFKEYLDYHYPSFDDESRIYAK